MTTISDPLASMLAELVGYIGTTVTGFGGRVSTTYPQIPVTAPECVLDVVAGPERQCLTFDEGRHLVRISIIHTDDHQRDVMLGQVRMALKNAGTSLTICHYAGVESMSPSIYDETIQAFRRDLDVSIVTITQR
jgi:hypothetical protein